MTRCGIRALSSYIYINHALLFLVLFFLVGVPLFQRGLFVYQSLPLTPLLSMASEADHYPSVHQLTSHHLVSAGISPSEAHAFIEGLAEAVSQSRDSAPSIWSRVSKELLKPSHPHPVHRLMYYSIYKNWDDKKMGPPLAWIPTK